MSPSCLAPNSGKQCCTHYMAATQCDAENVRSARKTIGINALRQASASRLASAKAAVALYAVRPILPGAHIVRPE